MEKAGSSVVRQLRFVVASWKEDTRTDVELLSRFVQTRDEQAFSTLVGRHSELVWGVCLRVLRNPTDAEDALQATFLRLARDAKRILNREALGAWLFRVARDCAIDLRRSIARQRRIEERVAEVANRTGSPDVPSDLRVLLDDELAQLPRSESAVLILCCLEGRTYADAALELGCSTAAVHRRFVRAQTRLRRKFAKHGPAAVGVLAAVLSGAALPAASAAPVAALADVVETGLAVARSGVVPATRAGLLIGSAPRAFGRAGVVAAVAAAVLAVGAFATLVAGNRPDPKPAQSAREGDPAPESAKSATTLTGTVRGPNGQPVAGAKVAVLARRPFGPGERGLRDELLATVAADAEGKFTLPVPDDFDTWFAGRVVTVQASGPNLAPATVAVRLRPAPAAVELNLKPAVALRGQLVDEAGRPAPGVRLEIVRVGDAVAEPVVGRTEQAPPAWPLPVVSAADGTFAVPVLGGSANVWARVNDARFALDTFRLDVAGPGGPRRYSLAPARPLVVEVRAADTDAPLPGARVTVITDRVSAHPHFCATDHGVLSARSVPSDIDALTDARGQVRVNLAPGDRAEVLVHAPASAGPYIGVRTRHAVGAEGRLVVRLPRGVWASGTVTDASGKPLSGAAVHWGREAAALPEWKDEVLVGRDAITRTGPDGGFKLAVLPGACSIRVYGPTADYEPASAKLPGTTQTTIYAHHIAALDAPPSGGVPPLKIALREAPAVSGAVERHAADSGTAFVLCSGRVSAVRGYAALPLPVRDGAFTVPGCRAGFTSRAYLLDPVAKLGAVVDLTPGAPVPPAKWLACGTLRVRVVDADGRPQANQDVHLALLAARDRVTGSTDEPATDAQPVEWFDATNYPARPKTDARGVAELPALVPGARYSLAIGTGPGRVAVGKFLIESGKVQALPDVVLPRRVEGGSQ